MRALEVRRVLQGFVAGALVLGCAGATYTYYGMDLPDECYAKGSLLAHTPKDDQPLEVCKPDAQNKLKCVHLLTPEFERMRLDLDRCEKDLVSCQQQLQTSH